MLEIKMLTKTTKQDKLSFSKPKSKLMEFLWKHLNMTPKSSNAWHKLPSTMFRIKRKAISDFKRGLLRCPTMDSDWIEFKCMSGKTLLTYNKITGEYKWPSDSDTNTVIPGQTLVRKEFSSIGTQTDDTDCENGCTSIYVHKNRPTLQEIPTGEELPVSDKPIQADNTMSEQESVGDDQTTESTDNSSQEQLIETPGRRFSCGYCKKTFSTQLLAQDHIKIHSDERPFQCTFCQMKFKRKKTLKGHMKTHTRDKPFQCSYCQKHFRRKETLKGHLRTHTGEKPFKCSHCDNSFRHKKTLKDHQRIHTGEKPFECDICHVKFRHVKTLNDHQRIHTGEKPFECSICKKRFAQKKYLNVHQKTHYRNLETFQEDFMREHLTSS